jgi:hypothetical protein
LAKVESNAHAVYSARDTETGSSGEPEFDSTLDRTSNDLGDIERAADADQDREDSDIERAH